jgi:YHS domain-containing protein
MKARWIIVSLCALVLLAVGKLTSAENEAGKKFAATCPVSGKPAGESHMLALKNGDKVYFCCDNCPKAFEADRKKFRQKVNRQLAETGQIVQVACPLTGKPVNKEVTVAMGETEVGLCCKNCLKKVEAADDDAKVKLLFANAALKKGFTRQVLCPVSGKPINPQASVEYEGEKVYFCCPNCPKAFEADPEKFVAKLPQFKKGTKAK